MDKPRNLKGSSVSCEIKIAWAAGLFEGEGHIGIYQDRYVRLVLGSTDLDVLERFVSIVDPGGKITKRKMEQEHHRQFYQWKANDARKVILILEMLLPWLGERRGKKGLAAIACARDLNPNNRDKTHCPQGHPYDGANTCRLTRGGRICRRCAREKEAAKRRSSYTSVQAT